MSTPVAGQFNPTPISYQQQAYRGLPPNLQQQYQPLTFDQQQLYQSLDPYQQQRYLSLNVYHRQLYGWFVKVDTDNSGYLSASELQQALVNGDRTHFDLDTVKLLMSMFDANRNGEIDFNEFIGLWEYVREWQEIFRGFDTDGNGTLEQSELSRALDRLQYNLSPRIVQAVLIKYAANGPGPGPLSVSFDRFIRACVFLKKLRDAFSRLDTNHDGWIQIHRETFMETVLNLP